ncbi:c-type cytochrome [Uliginosibacterium aquaticum]|uniref:Cytochrome c5 family protein n=1 Tax=Uliginosibacterium aquaticum TaxID=2731212 RepID=A0ABX2IBF3_9RHOO|nr:c-type cytochrome [Uliginosibacterium aquaticum]NSL53507.1 cytochrome c5 family protein [Uliginosibacterium aquaticum]
MNSFRPATLLLALIAAATLVACGKAKVDEEKTAELIQPVARVELAATAPAEAAATGGAPKSGEQVVAQVCGACHSTGAAGAPKIGDKAAWAPRIAQGLSTLVASVTNGKNAMPARGGNPALSDEELKAAVDYLVKQAK